MDLEARRIEAYFSQINTFLGSNQEVEIIAVAHLVSNSEHFLPALNSLGRVALLLPKPSSENSESARVIRSYEYNEGKLSRDWLENPKSGVQLIKDSVTPGSSFIVVDIGGYFCPLLSDLKEEFGNLFLGVMEGTENGVQKYEELEELPVPVVTVARSPLKLPEDYLVGASIVYSVEAILRDQSQILQTRKACLIGYGRVGSGVAEVLRGRGVSTVVHDTSPIAMAEAAARGFQVFRRLDEALRRSDLVISATGCHALDAHALYSLRNGSLVALVTSGDDEFGRDNPLEKYEPVYGFPQEGDDSERVEEHKLVVRYEGDNGKHFLLANDGRAANFAHGAVIGPAIQLIEGEKLIAVKRISENSFPCSELVQEVCKADRLSIANIWNEHFLDD